MKDYSKYTFLQKIKIFYINYLNIFHRIDMIININCSINNIVNQFQKLYHIPCDRYSDDTKPLSLSEINLDSEYFLLLILFGLSIMISTLREGYDGEVTENNIEIAILKSSGFELLTPEQVKNYLKD